MKCILEVNFTLTVLPENESFYHQISVMALLDIGKSQTSYFYCQTNWNIEFFILLYPSVPPEFDAVCSESGIIFKRELRPFDYLWDIVIGSHLLTPQLATQRGYILTNDSQSLLLEVPLFTQGYVYEVRCGKLQEHRLLVQGASCFEHVKF